MIDNVPGIPADAHLAPSQFALLRCQTRIATSPLKLLRSGLAGLEAVPAKIKHGFPSRMIPTKMPVVSVSRPNDKSESN